MIRYKKYQNKNEKNVTTFNKWYARAVCEETVDIAALAEHVHPQHPLLHRRHPRHAEGHGELYQGAADGRQEREDRRPRHLQRGYPLEGAVTPEDFSTQGNIIGVRLRARATGNLSSASLKLTAKLREYTEYSNGEVTLGGGGAIPRARTRFRELKIEN